VTLDTAEMKMSECIREFKRILDKEDRVTELSIETKILGKAFYVYGTFEGTTLLTPAKNKETGELDRKRTTRKLEEIRIVYLPEDKEVLIGYSGGKQEKLSFLDTFLRIVCGTNGYEDKEQHFDLSVFKKETFDFASLNKGNPLLNWKIKSIALSFGEDVVKKKLRISLPSTKHELTLSPLFSTVRELNIEKTLVSCTIDSVALSYSFTKIGNTEKTVKVNCTVSATKASILPLLPYDRFVRSLLKQSHIDKGFQEKAVIKKEEAVNMWEV